MTTDRARQIESIFAAALDVAEGDLDEFLRERCGDDEKLRAELQRLLEHDSHAATAFLRSPFGAPPRALAPGDVIAGRYTLKRVIGEGGMGVVWLAEQDRPKRDVALKLIRFQMAAGQVLRRFEHEAALLGRLNHPGIAQIHEAGVFDDGTGARPFFAMEFVEGRSLREFVREAGVDVRERLALFVQVCEAVHHAHMKGVIHRDLKPANILVDSEGRPKILDFGVARATDADLQVTTMHTEAGQLVGTLPYMSPEQVEGRADRLDTRSDVYALGVVLYEVLADRLPYAVDDKTIAQTARIITEADPTPLTTVSRAYRGDLNTIVLKALQKEPGRRYQSASDLAADVRRFLSDEPIIARPPSTIYQLRKFARRNKALVAAMLMVFVVLVAATVVSLTFAVQAVRARGTAQLRAEEARAKAYVANLAAASAALQDEDIVEARRRLLAVEEPFRHHLEWRHLHSRLDHSTLTIRNPGVDASAGPILAVNRDPASMVHALAYHPSEDMIATAAGDGIIRLWNPLTGDALGALVGHEGSVLSVAFTPDGSGLVSGGEDAIVRLWSVPSREVIREFKGHDDAVTAVAVSPDGRLLATGSLDKTVALFDTSSGGLAARLRGHEAEIWSVAFAPDSRIVGSASDDGTARLWDAVTGETVQVLRGHEQRVKWIDFSPDGATVATGSMDHTVRLWNLNDGSEREVLRGHAGRTGSVAFSADGAHLLSASNDRTLRLWELESGRVVAVLTGHENFVFPAVFSPDDSRLASVSYDGTIRVWDGGCVDEPYRLTGHAHFVDTLDFSSDGTVLASGGRDGRVRLWDAASGLLIVEAGPFEAPVSCVVFSSDGRFVSVAAGREVHVRDLVDWSEHGRLTGHEDAVRQFAYSPDGTQIATASADATVRLWSADDHRHLGTLGGHEGAVTSVAFAPDGRRLATGGQDKTVRVWDLESFEQIASIAAHDWHVRWVAFTPDGRRIISAGLDGKVRFWDAETLEADGDELTHEYPILQADLSDDGTRIAVAGIADELKLWNTATGEEVLALRGAASPGSAVAFSPAGGPLVSGSLREIRIWDVVPLADRLDARRAWLEMERRLTPLLDEGRFEAAHNAAERRVAGQLALRRAVQGGNP